MRTKESVQIVKLLFDHYLIKIEDSKQYLEQCLNQIKTCEQVLIQFLEFYQKYKIKPQLEDPDEDMLLFQYGSYDWDGTGKNFEFNLTRQFENPDPRNDEFIQLSLTLFYNENDVGKIASSNAWSIDFPNIVDWKNHILKSEAYKKVSNLPILKIEIELHET